MGLQVNPDFVHVRWIQTANIHPCGSSCFVFYSLLDQPGESRIPFPRERLTKFAYMLIPLNLVHAPSLAGELKHEGLCYS